MMGWGEEPYPNRQDSMHCSMESCFFYGGAGIREEKIGRR